MSVHAPMVAKIRGQLEQRPLWLVLPVELQGAFKAWHFRDLRRYIRVSSLPLLLLVYTLALSATLELGGQLSSRDAFLWTLGAGSVCGLLTLALALAQSAVVQRYYTWLAIPFSVVILAKFVAMPQLMAHPALVMSESLFCMITITIVILALRLTLLQGGAGQPAGGAGRAVRRH